MTRATVQDFSKIFDAETQAMLCDRLAKKRMYHLGATMDRDQYDKEQEIKNQAATQCAEILSAASTNAGIADAPWMPTRSRLEDERRHITKRLGDIEQMLQLLKEDREGLIARYEHLQRGY